MAYRRPLHVLMTAMCCAVLLAAGAVACGSGGTTSSSTTSAAEAQSGQTDEALSAPPPESTGAEQPQSQQNQPAVELAALPVGGSEEFDSSSPKCVFVSWTGDPLPKGVKFQITDVVVTGDFRTVGGGSCEDPCPAHIFAADTGHCNANVAWTKPPGSDGLQGALGLRGECVAPDAVTCNRERGDVDQQAQGKLVQLTALPSEQPPSSSSSSEANQSGAESSSGSSG
jgi:hypothetical protein